MRVTEFIRGKGPGESFDINPEDVRDISPRTNLAGRLASPGSTITFVDGSVMCAVETPDAILDRRAQIASEPLVVDADDSGD